MLHLIHLHHSSILIKFNKESGILVDPFKLTKAHIAQLPPNLILAITHPHFDHLSADDIKALSTQSTIRATIFPKSISGDVSQVPVSLGELVALDLYQEAALEDFKVRTIPAYNTNKINPQTNTPFHPKNAEWIGFVFTFHASAFTLNAPFVKKERHLEQISTVYCAGDTDFIPEMEELKNKVDVAFLPVSGTYVMDYQEALEAHRVINPAYSVPIHYGVIVGSPEDAKRFVEG